MRYRETGHGNSRFSTILPASTTIPALCSRSPARHDVARRVDCAFLARLVAEHRMDEDEAFEVIEDLTVNLARKTYRL